MKILNRGKHQRKTDNEREEEEVQEQTTEDTD